MKTTVKKYQHQNYPAVRIEGQRKEVQLALMHYFQMGYKIVPESSEYAENGKYTHVCAYKPVPGYNEPQNTGRKEQ